MHTPRTEPRIMTERLTWFLVVAAIAATPLAYGYFRTRRRPVAEPRDYDIIRVAFEVQCEVDARDGLDAERGMIEDEEMVAYVRALLANDPPPLRWDEYPGAFAVDPCGRIVSDEADPGDECDCEGC